MLSWNTNVRVHALSAVAMIIAKFRVSTLFHGKLDLTVHLNVMKYATILGTPAKPLKVDKWMTNLLQDKPPTFENKLDAVKMDGVTKKFLMDHKATINHPEMNTYKKLSLRSRAVNGFFEFDALHERVINEVFQHACCQSDHFGPSPPDTCSFRC